MVARYWLQDDQRDRSYNYTDVITDEMLIESYGFQENQLELVTSVGTMKFADRPKYVGHTYYEGRVVSLPSAERAMPELLSAGVELSQCTLRVANLDGLYTNFLPGGADYTTFIGYPVTIEMCLRNEENSKRPIFQGIVSHENGVSFSTQEITFKFRDQLDFLNNKIPLESITKEVYQGAPEESIGKLIGLAFGDWTANWEWIENGTFSYSIGAANVNVINFAPLGSGAGIPGTYTGPANLTDNLGGYFVFHTGGRAGKTYHPTEIIDVKIKRGSNYMQADFVNQAIPKGGHWTVRVDGVIARTIENEEIFYDYQYNSGDIAIIKTRIPIEGTTWEASRDTNPLDQARELLIALGRLSYSDIDGPSFENVRSYFEDQSVSTSWGRIAIKGDFPTELNGNLFGNLMIIPLFNASGQVIEHSWLFNDAWTNQPEPGIEDWNYGLNLSTYPSSNAADGGNAAKLAEWITFRLNENLRDYPYDSVRQAEAVLKVVSDTEAYVYINPAHGAMPATPTFGATPLYWEAESTAVIDEGLKTRIFFGDKDQVVLDGVSSLLKCALIDMYVNNNLQIAFSGLWPEHFPTISQMKRISQYDIVEASIDVSSDNRAFFTTAQANYAWIPWMSKAGATTKKMKNQTAIDKIGRDIIKEIDLPAIYQESAAVFVTQTYIRLASAALLTVKMQVGWKHLLRDLGEFVSVSIKLGSVNFLNVPCQIRRIAVLPEMTGAEITMVSFVNFSFPEYDSPSASNNLSSYDIALQDA